MPKISLCLIARNEEANLPACLGTVADLLHETVVVDTGSTDATKKTAERLGARVFDFPWVDDFSIARNESIDRATGDWIFWLDADDRIDDDNRCKLRDLFSGLTENNVAYMINYVALREGAQDRTSSAQHVKLFRRHPQIRWRYRVHEQIAPSIEKLGARILQTDIVIHHLGYQDPELLKAKLRRNLRLLRLDYAENPTDPFVIFNLGRTTMRLGNLVEALPLLRQSTERLPTKADFLIRTAFALGIEALGQLGRHQEALRVAQIGLARFPTDPELLLGEALMMANLGDISGAEARLRRLLEIDPRNAAARHYLQQMRPSQAFFRFDVG
jgi:tetratricopeptide (TPR) repeat protein